MSEQPLADKSMILVVDDEEDLRDIMRRQLERRGYATLTAGDPQEALAHCREHAGAIDAMIVDLTLPGASGGDLAADAVLLRPELGVVFISGLPKDIAVDKGLVGADALLVKKPFTADLLLEALRTVLDPPEKKDDGDDEDGKP